MLVTGDMLKKMGKNPLFLMAKLTSNQIKAVETSTAQFAQKEKDIKEPAVDQVYCQQMELPEMRKLAVYIQKIPMVKFAVCFASETQLEIQSEASLLDAEIEKITIVLAIPRICFSSNQKHNYNSKTGHYEFSF